MANGRRGGLATLGFPQFNAGGQGGVIPQLQLRPAPINFPRAGGGGGGGRKEINPERADTTRTFCLSLATSLSTCTS